MLLQPSILILSTAASGEHGMQLGGDGRVKALSHLWGWGWGWRSKRRHLLISPSVMRCQEVTGVQIRRST